MANRPAPLTPLSPAERRRALKSRASSRTVSDWLHLLPCFYAPLVLLLCVAEACRPLSGSIDTWAHAAIGRWIAQHGHVPQQSLFIWGAAPIRWIAHSWGTQLLFYELIRVGGPALVIAFAVLCVLIVFGAIWYLWQSRAMPNIVTVLMFTIAIWCSSPRFYPRPELFTGLFLTTLLLYLVRWWEALEPLGTPRGNAKAFGIVMMFIVWANVHGAVALGLVFLALTIICDAIQRHFDRRVQWLVVIFVICGLATLLNPYGAELWQALRAVKSATFNAIDEWKNPWRKPALPTELVVGEAILVAVTFYSWCANRGRRWAYLAWLIFATASFLSARRNLWVLAIVCLVIMAANAPMLDSECLWRKWRQLTQKGQEHLAQQPIPTMFHIVARVGAVLCLMTAIVRVTPSDFYKMKSVKPTAPVALTRFFRTSKLNGRVFNDYEYSSYLQWAFGGHPPLFIDLLNAYPDYVMNDYFSILNQDTRGLQLLKRIEIVILRPHRKDEAVGRLDKFISKRPNDWVRIYRHQDGSIWVRRIAKYRALWQRALRQQALRQQTLRQKALLQKARHLPKKTLTPRVRPL